MEEAKQDSFGVTEYGGEIKADEHMVQGDKEPSPLEMYNQAIQNCQNHHNVGRRQARRIVERAIRLQNKKMLKKIKKG